MESFIGFSGHVSHTRPGDLALSARPHAPILPAYTNHRHNLGSRWWHAAKRRWTPLRRRLADVRVASPIRARIVEWRE